MANEDKKRALDAAIAKLEKDFGKGTVMRLGDPAAQVAVETIPTGSLSLDLSESSQLPPVLPDLPDA